MDTEISLPNSEVSPTNPLDVNSLQERQAFWLGKTTENPTSVWNQEVVNAFNGNQALKDPANDSSVGLYRSLGIDPVKFTSKDAAHLQSSYFSGENGQSDIKKFIADVENYYKASNKTELTKDDLNSIHWIGHLFGEKTSVQIVMQIQDELRASAVVPPVVEPTPQIIKSNIPEVSVPHSVEPVVTEPVIVEKEEISYPDIGEKLNDTDRELMKLAVAGLGEPAAWDKDKLHSIGYILSFKDLQTAENTQMYKDMLDYIDDVAKIQPDTGVDTAKLREHADEVFKSLMRERFDQKLMEQLKQNNSNPEPVVATPVVEPVKPVEVAEAPVIPSVEQVQTEEKSDELNPVALPESLSKFENEQADVSFKEIMKILDVGIVSQRNFDEFERAFGGMQSTTTKQEKLEMCKYFSSVLQRGLVVWASSLGVKENIKTYIQRLNKTVDVFQAQVDAENQAVAQSPVGEQVIPPEEPRESPISKLNRLSVSTPNQMPPQEQQVVSESPTERMKRMLNSSRFGDDQAA